MKTAKYFLGAAAVCGVFSMSSCSEDNSGIIDGNVSLAPITLNATVEGDDNSNAGPARAGLIINNDNNGSLKNVQNSWYNNDVVWAWSSKTSAYNKLVPTADDKDTFGQSAMGFSSGTNVVSYEPSERLILINSGDQTLGTSTANSGYNLTLKRSNDDNDMVLVYGDGTGEPYSDAGNAFSLKRTSADITEAGLLVKTASNNGDSEPSAFVSLSPKLLIELPASSDEDVEALSKLTYKFIVTMNTGEDADKDSKGFPKEFSLKYVSDPSKIKSSNSHQVFQTDDVDIQYGNSLQVKFTANGADAKHKSSSLWNKTDGASDKYLGYVFIPVPPVEYTGLTVKVRVEKPEGVTDTSVDDVAGKTYTLTYSGTVLESVTVNSKGTVNKVFKLGAIWNRTSSAKPTNGAVVGTGWVVTEND